MTTDQILNGSLESDIRRAFTRLRPACPPQTFAQALIHVRDGQATGFAFLAITSEAGPDLVTGHGTWDQAATMCLKKIQDPAVLEEHRRRINQEIETLQASLNAITT